MPYKERLKRKNIRLLTRSHYQKMRFALRDSLHALEKAGAFATDLQSHRKEISSMSIFKNELQQPSKPIHPGNLQLRAIAYSLDTLIPGLYIWLGAIKIMSDMPAARERRVKRELALRGCA